MEHGKRVPSVAILVTLAKLYRISLSALFEAAAGADPTGPESLSPGLQLADYVAAPEPGFRELHERHWNNRPDLRDNARRFANDVFEPVRAILGMPLRWKAGIARRLSTGRCSGARRRSRPTPTAWRPT